MGDVNGRRSAAVVAVLILTVATASVWAQDSQRGERVIHRYFDSSRWFDDDPGDLPQGGDGGESSADEQPRHTQQPPSARGESPGLWLSPGQGEWIWTPDGPVGPSQVDEPHGDLQGTGGQTELDGHTDTVDQLDYQASFDPSVVPFKRVGVQNRVRRYPDGRYAAYLDEGSYRSVDVGGSIEDDEERFWGSFLLQADRRQYHRIPSVSPGQRIISVESEPVVPIQFVRDEADNFYVATDFEGLLRLNVELGVERRYFDGALDESVQWEQFEASDDIGEPMRRRAVEVLSMIGIDRESMSPAEAMHRLVKYHRQFEARPFPDTGGDRYLDITQRQVGVCRHRGLTFTITAQAAGFETRYVYNEAHAFVEINWPGQGWRRIDLGGVADDFQYQNHDGGAVHDGLWDPEFPRPENYEEELAAMGGDNAVDVDAGSRAVLDGDEIRGDGPEQPHGDEGHADGRSTVDDGPTSIGDVEILEANAQLYRGHTVELRGRVESSRPEMRVEIVLLPVGAQTFDQAIELGVSDIDSEGYFEGQWEVPSSVSLGRWRLDGRVVESR